MPAYWLQRELIFPPAEWATEDGLVAVGGDASAERLILAYSQGIFPWPHPDTPLLWFSPDPRFVLKPSEIHVSRSLRKRIYREPFTIRFDSAFGLVLEGCASRTRPGQDGTWITPELKEGYQQLFQAGLGHSIEAWIGDRLVGGLYGVSLGHAFFGESMFSLEADASKIAFVTLAAQLQRWNFDFIDCQVQTDHLGRFGAQPWPRNKFLKSLRDALSHPAKEGPWRCELSPVEALELLWEGGSER